ncbi:TetR/AcrR family transcriptional regulator [Nonomuraea rubra]|uniref:TetR/AcrR family transcriptional regulator n=1 Tax=Nonomuraea rubra TaxID=46180 RepID=UPI00361B95C0
MGTTMGRRERKKAQTRQALSEAALRLFSEHGYDGVTVAQIADEADVSIATLFAHVPDGKEALIFDDGAERRVWLVSAVRDRPPASRCWKPCAAAWPPGAPSLTTSRPSCGASAT